MAADGEDPRACTEGLNMTTSYSNFVFSHGNLRPPIDPVAIYAKNGRAFLGVRKRRDGGLEIVFDRIGIRRSVWQVVDGAVGIDGLEQACSRAIDAEDCMGTLYTALSTAGVRIVCIEERVG